MRKSLHVILTTTGAGLLLGSLAASARADILYVSDSSYLRTFTSAGVGSVFPSDSFLRAPKGLAFDAAGSLYVGDYEGFPGTGAIEKFTSDGVHSHFADFPIGVHIPQGLAFDSAGNLYVATSATLNTIWRFTPNGVRSVFADPNDGLYNIRGLAFDRAGDIYVAQGGGSATTPAPSIVKFTPAGIGSIFADASDGLLAPYGLAFDSAGTLYVANGSTNTIEKFTPDGVGSVFADANDGLSGPRGLAFDSAGNLYVAHSFKIEKFTPDGVGSVFAQVGGPSYLAFTDDTGVPLLQPGGKLIPEPATWSLLGLGMPALLGLSRRRRVADRI